MNPHRAGSPDIEARPYSNGKAEVVRNPRAHGIWVVRSPGDFAGIRAIVAAMAKHYQVTTTAATRDDAARLGRLAVEQRLAACAQVSGPITSVYWWNGKVEAAEEWVCNCKTSAAAVGQLTAALRQSHAYTSPEIVATPIEDGDADYLAWLDAETMTRST